MEATGREKLAAKNSRVPRKLLSCVSLGALAAGLIAAHPAAAERDLNNGLVQACC
jgi:hypothetical protein